MIKTFVTWEEIDKHCKKIISELKNTPDLILAIGKGGLIPSTIIANNINIKQVHNIGLASYNNKKRTSIKVYQTPNYDEWCTETNILIIDDILDSGNSIKYVNDLLLKKGFKNIQFATLHYKQTKNTYIPTNHIFSELIDENVWLYYPWE